MNFKFSVIKKNQILTWSVIVMLLIAGFLNYKNDPNKAYNIEVTGIIDENLGDAVLVDSPTLVTNIVDNVEDKNLTTTSAEYFSENRIARNNSYAEQLETYKNILSDANVSDAQKEFAQNLIKLKGIEEVSILVNKGSINVVALDDNLDDAKVAQIQNIIQNELGVEVDKIHINSVK